MSKMIPPFYDESITSDGEKRFFHALEALKGDYVVLHSLGIADHREKSFGEIDFVVICPLGVLCLEVKGGYVSRREGVWYFRDRYGSEAKKTEGPFKQAVSAMHSLRAHLREHFRFDDPVVRCQYACGVVFPDMPFTQRGIEIIPEIVFDSRRTQEEVGTYIKSVFAYWRERLERTHGFSTGTLSGSDIRRLANYLRGDFGFVPSLGYIVEHTADKLLALTRQQIDRLSIASENKRILLKGGAGTGKTLLALEYARRRAMTGKSVLYLCFNHNLCLYLQAMVARDDEVGHLRIDTFHHYILEELESNGYTLAPEPGGEQEFYSTILPEAFLEMSRHSHQGARFDTLVIDEGQDLLRYEYIMCLDTMVDGGLEKGNWYISYDPNQNIYNPGLEEGLRLIEEYNPTILTLDTNCRNTRPIGIHNTLCTGMRPERFFRVDGESVVKEPYTDHEDERRKLLRVVRSLLGQGIKPGNIILLSRYKFENSCLNGENLFTDLCTFQNVTRLDPRLWLDDSLKFCTVQSFKGLEAPVVILLDVESFEDMRSRLLNYTAMSRATSLLYVFYNLSAEEELREMVSRHNNLLKLIEG